MKIFQTTVLGLLAAFTTTSAFSVVPSGRATFSLMMSDEVAAVDESPVAAEEEKHTVYVGNLPFSSTSDQISDMFADKGIPVLNVAMPMNQNMIDEVTGMPKSKGFCFVDVESDDMITTAVEAFNNVDMDGRSMRVNKLLPKEEVEARQNDRNKNYTPDGQKKLYIGNLSFDATYDEIKDHFEQYGEVTDLYIPLRDDRPRGFCFITLAAADADTAMAELNGADFLGRSLVVNEPLKKGESLPPRGPRNQQFKLYVGNLSFYTTKETLQGVFEEFGEVLDCYLPTDPNTDQPRGFGFISMNQADGENAIAELDGLELDGRFIRVNEAQGKRRPSPPPQSNYGDEEDW
jgi:RNA recognition motif-containing protein|mmetsp:Transcript_8520/g.17684  ORF Transcript_8520/g.17684 Transcript_8520/m.17684 type:complete len:347 (-) Transcript_8520:249-1289(-)